MVPYGCLKIYSKAENGRTIDVRQVNVRLEVPGAQPPKPLTRISVRLKDKRVYVLDDLERVICHEPVDRGVLKITWDGEVLYEAGKRLY